RLEAVLAAPLGDRAALVVLGRATLHDSATPHGWSPLEPLRMLPIPFRRKDPGRSAFPTPLRPDHEDPPDGGAHLGSRRQLGAQVWQGELRDGLALRPRQAASDGPYLEPRLGRARCGRS